MMHNNEISINDALNLPKTIFIDLRSPLEFNESKIPGSINIPLFTDKERENIGTTYHKIGHHQAKLLGLEFISPKLPAIIKQIDELSQQGTVVLYCWRGGMRSKSILHVAKLMNLPVYRLIGGYKAYREFVFKYLQRPITQEFIILDGLTGVGKTDILWKLKEMGQPVLNLEELAKNRGSVFGSIGMNTQPSQKQFESYIVTDLMKYSEHTYIFIECESKRIGRVYIPDSIWEKMQQGKRILVYSSMEKRIERIISTYSYEGASTFVGLQTAINKLTKRLGKEKVNQLTDYLANNDLKPLVRNLLIDYYDPYYKYPASASDIYAVNVCSDDLEEAISKIINLIK